MDPFSDEVQPLPEQLPPGRGLKRVFAWGLLDQLLRSATNFGLSLFAGRLLGVSGLGVIAIGFSMYLIVLSFHRALVSEPLIIVSSVQEPDVRGGKTRSSITATVGLGLAAGSFVAVAGLWIGGDIGRGLVIFAPWIAPALLQDLWRMLLFRDDRGRAAAANDGVWLATMSLCLAFSLGFRADWIVAACWGAGALASTIVGYVQLRPRGSHLRVSWEWLTQDAWPVGRWFVAENCVYTVASQAAVFLLAGLIGAAAVGGLRSAEVMFAPLSLLGPAIALPGLPLIRKAVEESYAEARTLAFRLSVVLVALTSIYLLASSIGQGALFTFVFGDEFAAYRGLIWPVGVNQLMTAAAAGYILLLKAHRRGKPILLARTLTSVVALVLLAPLSLRFGIMGGAWAIALGAGIGTASIIAFSSKIPRTARAEGVP
jgi:O-antigen/teichoic acid export membrane protein